MTAWISLRGAQRQRLPPRLGRTGLRAGDGKLAVLAAATCLEDLGGLPGNSLDALEGDRKGQHSIRINDPWRLCFHWQKTDAFDVEIVDYH